MDPKQQEALHIQPCDEFSNKTEEIIRPSVHVSVSVFEKTINAANHLGDDIKLPRKAICKRIRSRRPLLIGGGQEVTSVAKSALVPLEEQDLTTS